MFFTFAYPARRLCRRLLCALVTAQLLAVLPAVAENVADIYSAVLDVESRGARELAEARAEGLAQVLIKASGDGQALEQVAVQQALAEAERYLMGYSFEDEADGILRVRLDYDERAVQQLLRDAGLPLWTANRPPVLVWLVLSDGSQRQFVAAGETPEASAALRDSFQRRGVPLQVPLFDLEDARSVTPGQAWRRSSPALIGASERYRGTELLAGRVARLSGGQWLGDWQFLAGTRWITRSVDATSLEAFLDAGAGLAAEALSARYAVTAADSDQRHRVTLRGVRSYADFMALHNALTALESVRRVVPERLEGDQVSLRVDAETDLEQLARIIELDGRFVPYPGDSVDLGLYYEWIQ